MSEFFKMYRKKGFYETLDILDKEENKQLKQSEFYKLLKKRNNYINAFFRVKKEMLQKGLIDYKIDKDADKAIYLTDKGLDILSKIKEIEELLLSKG